MAVYQPKSTDFVSSVGVYEVDLAVYETPKGIRAWRRAWKLNSCPFCDLHFSYTSDLLRGWYYRGRHMRRRGWGPRRRRSRERTRTGSIDTRQSRIEAQLYRKRMKHRETKRATHVSWQMAVHVRQKHGRVWRANAHGIYTRRTKGDHNMPVQFLCFPVEPIPPFSKCAIFLVFVAQSTPHRSKNYVGFNFRSLWGSIRPKTRK